MDCYKCKYYYVTWNKNFPHGCKAMNFKSRKIPSIVVRDSSLGIDCILFEAKRKIVNKIDEAAIWKQK